MKRFYVDGPDEFRNIDGLRLNSCVITVAIIEIPSNIIPCLNPVPNDPLEILPTRNPVIHDCAAIPIANI